MLLPQQLSSTHHSITKPTDAPSVVVKISSPDPTTEPTRMKLGPRCRSVARRPEGGSSGADETMLARTLADRVHVRQTRAGDDGRSHGAGVDRRDGRERRRQVERGSRAGS